MSGNRNFILEQVGDNCLWLRASPVWVGPAAELSQLVVGAYCQVSIFSQSSHIAELQLTLASAPWPWRTGNSFIRNGDRYKRDCLFLPNTVQVEHQWTLNNALSKGEE